MKSFNYSFFFNFQLSGKDCAPSIGSRHLTEGGGGGGGGLAGSSIDRKKPFSRPFNKSRLVDSGPSGIVTTASASHRMSSPSTSPTTTDTGVLIRQNNELRHRLQQEASTYRRRLETYKQAEGNQAALISRLQAKVLQYKQRCTELQETPPSSTCYNAGGGPARDVSPGHHHAGTPAPCSGTSGGPLSLPPCPVARERSRSRSRSQSPCRKYADCGQDEVRHQLDEERRRWVKQCLSSSKKINRFVITAAKS